MNLVAPSSSWFSKARIWNPWYKVACERLELR